VMSRRWRHRDDVTRRRRRSPDVVDVVFCRK